MEISQHWIPKKERREMTLNYLKNSDDNFKNYKSQWDKLFLDSDNKCSNYIQGTRLSSGYTGIKIFIVRNKKNIIY